MPAQRSPSELSSHQRKVFAIDKHVGIGIAGLTSDGRSLCTYLQGECLSHRWHYDEALPLSRMISALGLSESLSGCMSDVANALYRDAGFDAIIRPPPVRCWPHCGGL